MNSPYKHVLERLKDQEISIDRANASTLKGRLANVDEGGCFIATPPPEESLDESSQFVFVAYEDIRGVGHVDWDYVKIGK